LAAVPKVRKVNPEESHKRIALLYDWKRVAEQTVRVYEKCLDENSRRKPRDVLLQYQKQCGAVWGKIFVLFWVIDWMLLQICNLFG
jgi:hypothetical protein